MDEKNYPNTRRPSRILNPSKLDERGREVKERTKEKAIKRIKDTYTDRINKGMIY